jgi:hypothetical protein
MTRMSEIVLEYSRLKRSTDKVAFVYNGVHHNGHDYGTSFVDEESFSTSDLHVCIDFDSLIQNSFDLPICGLYNIVLVPNRLATHNKDDKCTFTHPLYPNPIHTHQCPNVEFCMGGPGDTIRIIACFPAIQMKSNNRYINYMSENQYELFYDYVIFPALEVALDTCQNQLERFPKTYCCAEILSRNANGNYTYPSKQYPDTNGGIRQLLRIMLRIVEQCNDIDSPIYQFRHMYYHMYGKNLKLSTGRKRFLGVFSFWGPANENTPNCWVRFPTKEYSTKSNVDVTGTSRLPRPTIAIPNGARARSKPNAAQPLPLSTRTRANGSQPPLSTTSMDNSVLIRTRINDTSAVQTSPSNAVQPPPSIRTRAPSTRICASGKAIRTLPPPSIRTLPPPSIQIIPPPSIQIIPPPSIRTRSNNSTTTTQGPVPPPSIRTRQPSSIRTGTTTQPVPPPSNRTGTNVEIAPRPIIPNINPLPLPPTPSYLPLSANRLSRVRALSEGNAQTSPSGLISISRGRTISAGAIVQTEHTGIDIQFNLGSHSYTEHVNENATNPIQPEQRDFQSLISVMIESDTHSDSDIDSDTELLWHELPRYDENNEIVEQVPDEVDITSKDDPELYIASNGVGTYSLTKYIMEDTVS